MLDRFEKENPIMKATADFHKSVIDYLKDADAAAEYLNAAIEDGDPRVFYIALRDVAEAQGNMSQFAKKCKIPRSSLYNITSKEGKPSIETIIKIIKCLGLNFKIENKRNTRPARA